ncbi:hypothetical protein EDD92_6707 [Streptomyces sp. TLI_185]|nr:hypothetical protein EDD92_6707 [Streptomyces sp. TLI_185]
MAQLISARPAFEDEAVQAESGGLGAAAPRGREWVGAAGARKRCGGYSADVAFNASHNSIRTSGSSSDRPRISSTRRIRYRNVCR